jgi:hypothetical protein
MKSLIQKITRFFSFRSKKAVRQTANGEAPYLEEQIAWWGDFVVEEEHSRFFKVGNIVICLDRYSRQWHITTYREGEKPFKNFAAQAANHIALRPTMPERALLSPLERPFYISPGEVVLLYISAPIWICLQAGTPPILLDEIPTETLLDTWFGKNTQEGELCYATATYCSTELDDLPRDTTRIISLVSIENHSKTTLLLQELKIPVPYLSIFSDPQNCLWTEQLNVQQKDAETTETSIIKGPPAHLKDTILLTPPRLSIKPGLKNLFGLSMWK